MEIHAAEVPMMGMTDMSSMMGQGPDGPKTIYGKLKAAGLWLMNPENMWVFIIFLLVVNLLGLTNIFSFSFLAKQNPMIAQAVRPLTTIQELDNGIGGLLETFFGLAKWGILFYMLIDSTKKILGVTGSILTWVVLISYFGKPIGLQIPIVSSASAAVVQTIPLGSFTQSFLDRGDVLIVLLFCIAIGHVIKRGGKK